SRVGNGLKQRRFAIPLFADQSGFHARLQREVKVLQQNPEVLSHHKSQVLDNEHRIPPPLHGRRWAKKESAWVPSRQVALIRRAENTPKESNTSAQHGDHKLGLIEALTQGL